MTPESLLRALFDPDATLDGDAALTAAFARAARARRVHAEGGIAHGEWEDAVWLDEAEARALSETDAPRARLAAAADDESQPIRYSGGGWIVLFARATDEAWSVLLAGPAMATIELPGEAMVLTPRTWTRVTTPRPPSVVLLRLPTGQLLSLERQR